MIAPTFLRAVLQQRQYFCIAIFAKAPPTVLMALRFFRYKKTNMPIKTVFILAKEGSSICKNESGNRKNPRVLFDRKCINNTIVGIGGCIHMLAKIMRKISARNYIFPNRKGIYLMRHRFWSNDMIQQERMKTQ
ncbi:MAG: hypothetical protein Q8865_01270 [Bacillota bacterium]|nr:hypothetical protein [Bacillota bacterium]